MKYYDCLGNELNIGDRVIYFTNHRTAYHATIYKFTPLMAKVIYDDKDNQTHIATVLSDKSLLLNYKEKRNV